MIFYNATTKAGICQKIDSICDTNDNSFPRIEKTREVNLALQEIVNMIIMMDGFWQFDDLNYTDLPVGTGDLVAGQSSYSFAERFLNILTVKIKDAGGNWLILTPIDQKQDNLPLEDYLNTDAQPLYYDKLGDTIKLYPAPSAGTIFAGGDNIKVEFQRKGSEFTPVATTAEDTKEPGFDVEHDILAYMASRDHIAKYKPERLQYVFNIIETKKDIIKKFYGRREKDVRKMATTKGIRFR